MSYSIARLMVASTKPLATILGIGYSLAETAWLIYLLVTGQWAAFAVVLFIVTPIVFFLADIIVHAILTVLFLSARLINRRAVADYVELHA
jgi:hypothetical protein